MKINRLKSIVVGLAIAAVAITQYGCEQEWQKEFEPSVLKAPASVELAVSSIKDSTAVLTYTQSLVGQLYVVVVPGDEETPAPAENSLLKLTEANAVFTRQIFVTNEVADGLKPMNNKVLTDTLNIKGLVQNVSYKVFALPVNTDGVFGAVGTTPAFNTADYDAPVAIEKDISPKLLDDADSVNFAVTIPFNEPIVIKAENKDEIFFTYLDLKTGVPFDEPADAKVDGSNLIVEQTYMPLPGQPVLLTIGANVISDRANNFYEGKDSQLANFPDIFLWYAAPVIDTIVSIAPDTASVVTDVNFDIDITYGIEMDFFQDSDGEVVYNSKDVITRYTYNGVTIDVETPASNIAFNGKVVSITPPRTPIYGETVTLKIAEGAFGTIYGSDCEAVEFNDYEWFVSYGYERDIIIGTYLANCVSAFTGDVYNFNVTIAADAESDNGVTITGLENSTEPLMATFNGDFATLTLAPFQSLGDLEGNGDSEVMLIDFGGTGSDIIGTIAANGTITVSWGSFISGGPNDNYFWDRYTNSTWTKGSKTFNYVERNFQPIMKIK